MRSIRRGGCRGLSLLELVLVLLILTVVAGLAWHRLIDLQTSARQARLQAAFGSVRAAAALFKAQCLALQTAVSGPGVQSVNAAGAPCAELELDGVRVTGVHAYPTADAGGIARAARLDATDQRLSAYSLSGGGPGAGSEIWISLDSPRIDRCRFAYRAPTQSGHAPMLIWKLEQTRCD